MTSLFSHRRSGFTLTEGIVVIILVVVVIGLLLPNIQTVRSSSAASGTSNNMKQMILSAHNYEATNKFLPPLDWNNITIGAVNPGPDGKPTRTQSGFHENFFSAIMPYAELEPQYRSLTHTGFTPASTRGDLVVAPTVYNLTIDVDQGISKPITLFLNPLDPTNLPSGMNVTGFAINGSALPMILGANGKKVSLESDFFNGTSNTIMIAEKYSGANGKSQVTPWTQTSCETFVLGDGQVATLVDGAAFGIGATLEFAPVPATATWANGIQAGRKTGMLLGMFDGSVRTLSKKALDDYQALTLRGGGTITLLEALIQSNDGVTNMPDW
jgi:type II secretory pathway pseudopilin PulG